MAPVVPNPKKIKAFKSEAAFETWLAPLNFDASGGQHQPLRIRTAG